MDGTQTTTTTTTMTNHSILFGLFCDNIDSNSIGRNNNSDNTVVKTTISNISRYNNDDGNNNKGNKNDDDGVTLLQFYKDLKAVYDNCLYVLLDVQ